MSLFEHIRRGDEAILSLHQSIYNYVWDRWGIYVGTFRTWLVVLGFSDSIIIDVMDAFDPKRGLIIAIPGLLFTFILLWIVFIRDHLGKEWKLQHDGHYKDLNRKAENYQGKAGMFGRIALVVFLTGVSFLFEKTLGMTLLRYMGIFFFCCWSFGCGVMVREREPDRFLSPVPQGT